MEAKEAITWKWLSWDGGLTFYTVDNLDHIPALLVMELQTSNECISDPLYQITAHHTLEHNLDHISFKTLKQIDRVFKTEFANCNSDSVKNKVHDKNEKQQVINGIKELLKKLEN